MAACIIFIALFSSLKNIYRDKEQKKIYIVEHTYNVLINIDEFFKLILMNN